MKLRNVALLLLVFCCLGSRAQDTPGRSGPAFHAIGSVGLLEGGNQSSFQLQLLNGFAYKSWFAGIGTGLDYYFIRTIPVTAYIEKQVSPRLPIFLYGSGGLHFVWRRNMSDEGGWYNSDYNHGLYYDAGLGYRFNVANRSAIRLSVGFSEKQFKETRKYTNWITWPTTTTTYTETYRYNLQRLSLRAGFQF